MRITMTRGQLGYQEWIDLLRDGRPPRVYLDGVPQRNVYSASEEAGEVVVMLKTDDGRWRFAGNGIATETRRGKVRIEVPEARAN